MGLFKNDAGLAAPCDVVGAEAKILGGGCKNCNLLETNTVKALAELGLDTGIEHVKDYAAIVSYGVMTTPALVFRGRVLSSGRVLSVKEIVELIKKEL